MRALEEDLGAEQQERLLSMKRSLELLLSKDDLAGAPLYSIVLIKLGSSP